MPLLTVILPTCDRPALLPRAVASVLAQSERDFELLVIDNNRRTPPVAANPVSDAPPDPRLRIVSGAGATNAAGVRNVGLAAARGEWIAYLDDDDTYRPEKLARQLALVRRTSAPLVLCGATFHLQGRTRDVQCGIAEWRDADLLLKARWNTSLLFHRRDATRFDVGLDAAEDAEFAHRFLAAAGTSVVPVVPDSLVDIHPQAGPRVNANPAPVLRAAARVLALRRPIFTRPVRRRYLLQNLLAVAKLERSPARCLALGLRLLGVSRGEDWRAVANALVISTGFGSGRWVS